MPDPTGPLDNPDVAAELRLLRAEIAALRNPPPHPAKPHVWFPGFDSRGHLILPAQHYRLTGKIRKWLHLRIRAGPLPHAKISRQRKMAIWLTATSAVRVLVWTLAMGIIVLHWCGVTGSFINWFTTLSGTVIFVTFISFYCNAATDGASLTASIAALFSADSHAAVVATGAVMATDLDSLEDDIARLADLQPGAEASALAAAIRRRLAGRNGELRRAAGVTLACMSTDPLERRLTEALARDQGASQAAYALTTCYAAGMCQRDLCCPFAGDCRTSAAEMVLASIDRARALSGYEEDG